MAGLLNVSEMSSLALHALLKLAEVGRDLPGARLSVAQLAESLEASPHTLHKVVKRLVDAGLLDSARGPSGGVSLKEDPARVNVLRVVEAVDGKAILNTCLFTKRVCPADAPCAFACLTQDLEQTVRDYFMRTTINDLAASFTPVK